MKPTRFAQESAAQAQAEAQAEAQPTTIAEQLQVLDNSMAEWKALGIILREFMLQQGVDIDREIED